MNHLKIDKSHVALRFAQAGQSYTQHAIVQKQIAQHLFNLIREYCPEYGYDRIFEMGCGSGNLTHLFIQYLNIKKLILNDLYPEVQQYFNCEQAFEWCIGDIEQFEFPQHLDLIASSSVLQWMTNLDVIFQKSFHSLNPHGSLCFSTFGQQNLKEIKMLTGMGLDYLSIQDIQEKLKQQGFEVLYLSEDMQHLNFAHPQQILQHLKATGVTATASNFRWTKQSLQDFYQNYQQFSSIDESGQACFTLTYHPIYCIARRMP